MIEVDKNCRCPECVFTGSCVGAYTTGAKGCIPFTPDDALKMMIDKIAKAMIECKTD